VFRLGGGGRVGDHVVVSESFSSHSGVGSPTRVERRRRSTRFAEGKAPAAACRSPAGGSPEGRTPAGSPRLNAEGDPEKPFESSRAVGV